MFFPSQDAFALLALDTDAADSDRAPGPHARCVHRPLTADGLIERAHPAVWEIIRLSCPPPAIDPSVFGGK
jgi:hypothetical protein